MKISAKDKDLTGRMIQSGDLLKINVLDHLIISEHAYESFAETGVMEELRKSKHATAVDIETERLTALTLEAERSKERISIAANLKKAGVDTETIALATGLKKAAVNKLT